MKNIITLLALIVVTITFAQAPEGFNYQAVARDAMGDIIVNTTIGVEFQLHETTIDGPVIYTETHSPTTNAYGIFNLIVGQGTSTDNFNLVDWATDLHFIETSIDVANGSTYVSVGITQLLSVPYALHAKTATNGITTAQATILGNTSGTNTGDQNLTVSETGDILTINGGNSVLVPGISLLNFPAPPAAIGDFRDGGIVFWIDPTDNTKGLVVDINNLSTSAEWGCSSTVITGADGSAIGTGAQNTIDIEAGCTTVGIAADLCANSTTGGFSDWFLPSTGELQEIFTNRVAINTTIAAQSGDDLGTDVYWSSTEVPDVVTSNAFVFVFGGGSLLNFNKINAFSVRGVRAF
jgi:hypothetical protein